MGSGVGSAARTAVRGVTVSSSDARDHDGAQVILYNRKLPSALAGLEVMTAIDCQGEGIKHGWGGQRALVV